MAAKLAGARMSDHVSADKVGSDDIEEACSGVYGTITRNVHTGQSRIEA